MFFQPFYLGCLSHGSYLLGSEGQALVIDPQRDVEPYIRAAEAAGLTITHVVETHLHADFVSGHVELAERTGATILVGAGADVGFPARQMADGEVLQLGKLRVQVLATPGHTPEGISLLVSDADSPEAPAKLFTGDTLFIGDVGRPDLAAGKGYTAAAMAGMLYDSLHGKILTLPDEVEVYPAHGAGSACGRAISDERVSTIGTQRRLNYALQPMSKAAFVDLMTTNLPVAPAYFAHNAEMNRQGAAALPGDTPLPSLSGAEVLAALDAGALIIDVREQDAYAASHVAGAINIGLDGRFASWAGSLIPFGSPLVLVAGSPDDLAAARLRLARVGYDRVVGVMAADADSWAAAGLTVNRTANVAPAEAADLIAQGWQLLDVRQQREIDDAHVKGAVFVPVDRLTAVPPALDPARPTAIICGSGYRSSAAVGLMERLGFRQLASIEGGMAAWQSAGLPTVQPAIAGA